MILLIIIASFIYVGFNFLLVNQLYLFLAATVIFTFLYRDPVEKHGTLTILTVVLISIVVGNLFKNISSLSFILEVF